MNFRRNFGEEEKPKSSHPLEKDNIRALMWDMIDWNLLLPCCVRSGLITKEQEEELLKVALSPEVAYFSILAFVKEQEEEGYQKFLKALHATVEDNPDLRLHELIWERLPKEIPPDSPPPELDELTLQRNWLARHFKSFGSKIDQASIHFSSMLVDVSKGMELDFDAYGVVCLRALKMIDGGPLLSGRFMAEAENSDNLLITLERNKVVHARDGHFMELISSEMDHPFLVRYVSEFHSQVKMPSAVDDGFVKTFMHDRFLLRTVVRKRTVLFDDVLRVKSTISEVYKIEKCVFQFRAWMKGAHSSTILIWQFPIPYLDYLEKMILDNVDEMLRQSIDRIEFHLKPGTHSDITVFSLSTIRMQRKAALEAKEKEASEQGKDKDDDDEKPDGSSSGGQEDKSNDGADAESETSRKSGDDSANTGMQTRSKTRLNSKGSNDTSASDKSTGAGKRDSDDHCQRKDDKIGSWFAAKKLKLACISNSLFECT